MLDAAAWARATPSERHLALTDRRTRGEFIAIAHVDQSVTEVVAKRRGKIFGP
jgi:hypothetical protein